MGHFRQWLCQSETIQQLKKYIYIFFFFTILFLQIFTVICIILKCVNLPRNVWEIIIMLFLVMFYYSNVSETTLQ